MTPQKREHKKATLNVAHSPLPWTIGGDGIEARIRDSNNKPIAKELAYGDAIQIVAAVNMHDELVEALKEAQEAMADVFRENKEIGRNYLSAARRHATEVLSKASQGDQ